MNKKYLFLLFLIFILISGCKKEGPLAPTFQGMVISESDDPTIVPLSLLIDQEDPFHNFDGETIEDEIKKDIKLIEEDECDYYLEAGQEMFLIIKVYNPEEYDFLSCVISGVRYQSYQFSSKSDYENIIIPFNTEKESGKKIMKIIEIQYSDGSKIKEVKILENNSVSYGIRFLKIPSKKCENLNITATSVSFDIKISDPDNLIKENGNILRAYLYDGSDIIKKIDFQLGDKNIKFDNLISDTLYQFAIATAYDIFDGEGMNCIILHKEAFRTKKIIEITSLIPSSDEISFELKFNDEEISGTLSVIELFEGEEKVATINDSTKKFSFLKSDTEYIFKITYVYGQGLEEVKEAKVRTHKQKPLLAIEFSDIGQTFLKYELKTTDPDLVCNITKIELYLDNDLKETKHSEDNPQFSGLLSGKLYQVQITFSYNLEDGKGEQVQVLRVDVETMRLKIPEIKIVNPQAEVDQIAFELSVLDEDKTGSIASVSLFKGEELIIGLEDFDSFIFTDLEAKTMYLIKAIYTYDLNDGSGERVNEITLEVPTKALPLEITEFTFLNQTLPRVGQEVHARIFFNNPSNVDVVTLMVNDMEVPVVLGKEKDNGIISFSPVTEGGNYEIKLLGFKYNSFGNTFYQEFQIPFITEILILGDLEVLELIVDKDIIGVRDSTPLQICLRNETDYLVTEIVLLFKDQEIFYRGSEINRKNKNLLEITWKEEVADYQDIFHVVSIIGITYGLNEYDVSSKAVSINKELLILKTLEPQAINSYDELINLENGYYYRLENDIDLFRKLWTPLSFNGIFDGNNYVIKNISLAIDTQAYEEQSYGLFASFNGIISNLELKDLYFSINTNVKVSVGALIGKAGRAEVRNCSVNGLINITAGELNFGGLVGEAKRLDAYYNLIDLNMSGTGSKAWIAGIIGSGEEGKLSGNLFTGKIQVTGATVTIHPLGLGNMVYEGFNNYLCYDSSFVINGSETQFLNLERATLDNLDNPEFFINSLEWSEDDWDFTQLDYEKGKLPILRK